MRATNGPTVEYELVYCWFRKEIYSLKSDGFFSVDGKERGILVREKYTGMHYIPENYLNWKHGTELC